MQPERRNQRHTFVEDKRTSAEIIAKIQRDMAEMGIDLVAPDDGSFALPSVLPATGLGRLLFGAATTEVENVDWAHVGAERGTLCVIHEVPPLS
jgi:hypothetical protein